jgi:Xaa-Pro dipeptidase
MSGRSFPPAEFHGRVMRLRAALQQAGADVMYIDESEILAYFTGFETSLNLYRACFIPLHGDPVMVLRALDVAPFRDQAWFAECAGFADTESPVGAVIAALTSSGFADARIGIDFTSHALTVATFQALTAGLPNASFVAMDHIPRELRLEKSDREIAMIARAAEIADGVVLALANQFRPGMSTRDATALAMHEYGARGADPHYVARISAGRGWDFLHASLSDTPLLPGDILHAEVAPSYGGYSARIMRSIAISGATADQVQSVERLSALQDAQFAAMRPGNVAGTVDAILRDGVLAQGLRDSYVNITGYTLGYYAQQPLRSSDFTRTFHPGAQWHLAQGMVFHMYTSAKAVSLSETVVVEADGARRLTQLPRTVLGGGGERA